MDERDQQPSERENESLQIDNGAEKWLFDECDAAEDVERTLYVCPICKYTNFSRKEFATHLCIAVERECRTECSSHLGRKGKDTKERINRTKGTNHWKRYQCSLCSRRYSWKSDVRKHIKVAHPLCESVFVLTLTFEEAKKSLPVYLAQRGGDHCDGVGKRCIRPYVCSVCGHRSNWKCDVRKHLHKVHADEGEVMQLSTEDAVSSIDEYLAQRSERRRSNQTRSLPCDEEVEMTAGTDPPSISAAEHPFTTQTSSPIAQQSATSRRCRKNPAPRRLIIFPP